MLPSKVSLTVVATAKGHSKLSGANQNLMAKVGKTNECAAPESIKTCASKEWT